MKRLPLPVVNGSSNVAAFSISRIPIGASAIDVEEFDFSANGVVRVTISALDEVITSDNGDVVYSSNTLYVKFGSLNLPPGKYFPTVTVFTLDDPDGKVISGKGFHSEIHISILG